MLPRHFGVKAAVLVALWTYNARQCMCSERLPTWNTRGLDEEAVRLYTNHILHSSENVENGPLFRCFDGYRSIPLAYVNDDYCDCVDGSDEPGTAACVARTDSADGRHNMFYCENKQHRPEYIYKWKVQDGLCDCCDGSDEEPRGGCTNNCKELGERWAAEQKRLRVLYEKARALRDQLIFKGKALAKEWTVEEADLRQRVIPDLEARIVDSTQKRDSEEAKRASSLGNDKENLSAHHGDEDEATKNQDGDLDEDAGRYSTRTVDDADEQDHHSDYRTRDDLGEELDEGDQLLQQHSEQADPSSMPENEELGAEPSEDAPKSDRVSEYAQWMANEDSKAEGVRDGKLDVMSDSPISVSRTSTPLRLVLHYSTVWFRRLLMSSQRVLSQGFLRLYTRRGENGTVLSMDLNKSIALLEEELKTSKQKLGDLKNKLELLKQDAYMVALLALEQPCLTATVDQYTYEVCLLQKATQRGNNFSSRIGVYAGTNRTKDGLIMHFDNGDTCWNGPPRSLKAVIGCGTETRLTDVTETERCTYTATIESPAGCVDTPEDTLPYRDEL